MNRKHKNVKGVTHGQGPMKLSVVQAKQPIKLSPKYLDRLSPQSLKDYGFQWMKNLFSWI